MGWSRTFEEATGGGTTMTDQEILDAVKRVDGSGSGLDADLLDNLNSTDFASASHVGSRNGHPLATTTADGFIAGTDKGKLDTLVPPERSYVAPNFTGYSRTFATGWQTTALANPKVTVPILGAAPTGFKWQMDISGGIRFKPSVNVSILISHAFDGGGRSADIIGGNPLNANVQGGVGISILALTPPTVTAAFTVEFYVWVNPADTMDVSNGPMPGIRCYLVRV